MKFNISQLLNHSTGTDSKLNGDSVIETSDRFGDLQDFEHPFVHVNKERCVGCQDCIRRCPTGALSIDYQRWIAQVDNDICVGCRQCERICAFSAILVDGPVLVSESMPATQLHPTEILGNKDEIRQGFSSWQEALSEAYRCLECPEPTCVRGCPAHNDIPGFIAAIRAQDLKRAHQVLARTSIMPDACSRVCDWDNQCQGACTWTLAGDHPVAIGRLERFITEFGDFSAFERTSSKAQGKKVAVVGAGPGGMAVAWELLAHGASVTMLEKAAETGGVMNWGIPSYVLPDTVPKRIIDTLIEAGLDLRTNTALGQDVELEGLLSEYDAVVLAYGASKPIHMPIKGIDLEGVEDANDFLYMGKNALRRQQSIDELKGARILVLGAGNTAMDVARTSLRLDAHPMAIDWMNEQFARVRHDELEEARLEGVEVEFLTTLVEIVGDDQGKVKEVVLKHTVQHQASELPKIIEDSIEIVPVDKVVFAMGYKVDSSLVHNLVKMPHALPKINEEIHDRRWLASGIFSVKDPKVADLALEREEMRLWAADPQADHLWVIGDAFSGPSTVVTSMAQGRDAARSIIEDI